MDYSSDDLAIFSSALSIIGSILLAIPFVMDLLGKLRRSRQIKDAQSEPDAIRRALRDNLTEQVLTSGQWSTFCGVVGIVMLVAAAFLYYKSIH